RRRAWRARAAPALRRDDNHPERRDAHLAPVDEAISLTRSARSTGRQAVLRRRLAAGAVYLVTAANGAVIVWLWAHGGNLHATSTGDVLTSIGRLTGLLSAYLALLQVILLARLPALERAV